MCQFIVYKLFVLELINLAFKVVRILEWMVKKLKKTRRKLVCKREQKNRLMYKGMKQD